LPLSNRPVPDSPISDDFRWLYDNDRLLYTDLQNVIETLKSQERFRTFAPRMARRPASAGARRGISRGAVSCEFSEQEFTLFLEVFQQTTALQVRELWTLAPRLSWFFWSELQCAASAF
jgi:hypothetical protein